MPCPVAAGVSLRKTIEKLNRCKRAFSMTPARIGLCRAAIPPEIQAMNVQVLPVRTAGAAENMALDFLLLQRPANPAAVRFRHYEWRGPACTFGFGQKIAFVRASLPFCTPPFPADERVDLCRRPTGGGIVDHRNDWTYSLVIPRGHALYDERAARSYQIVHQAIADALAALGQPVEVNRRAPEAAEGEPAGPGICFRRAELHDVVNRATGAKVAGAAQKRNSRGLLFQGSIEKGAVGPLDWDDFGGRLAEALGAAIGGERAPAPWPELDENEVAGLIEQYASPDWIEYR